MVVIQIVSQIVEKLLVEQIVIRVVMKLFVTQIVIHVVMMKLLEMQIGKTLKKLMVQ